MKLRIVSVIIFFMFSANVFADSPSSVDNGVVKYDWQTCVDSKSGDCLNACATSSDINCKDSCMSMSRDKCISEGVSPPPTQPSADVNVQ